MSNSCKKETANRSMRQVCYAQSCYDLFTTACRNSVSNSTVAALSHQFVADLFPTALLQFCQNSFVADLTTDCSSHVTTSELYIYGRLTSVNCVIKKCNTKWRKLKAFLGVIFSPLTCAVKYFCKFLFGFLWRKVFRNGFFPF